MGLTEDQELTIRWTRFSLATISLICSFCTLFLIYYMKIRSGYFLLITSMTFFQILYDINFMQGVLPGYANCMAWHFLDYLGGLSFSLWSNILSFIVLFIVVKIRSINIFFNYWYFAAVAVLPPIALAIMAMPVLVPVPDDDTANLHWCQFTDSQYALAVQSLYYWGRICTIAFNFSVFIYISYRVRSMTQRTVTRQDTKDEGIVTENPIPGINRSQDEVGPNMRTIAPTTAISQTAAIAALVSRMKYYPLAQAFARSGSAWDQFNNYQYSGYASSLMSALCGPSSGILNFIIFLVQLLPPKFYPSF